LKTARSRSGRASSMPTRASSLSPEKVL
jgi:hypothetical protein